MDSVVRLVNGTVVTLSSALKRTHTRSATVVDVEAGSSMVGRLTLDVSTAFPDDWDEFVASAPGGSHRQTAAWADVQSVRGWNPAAVSIRIDGRPIARAMVVTRRIGKVGKIAYIAGGPLVEDPGSVDGTAIAQSLQLLARRLRASVLVVDPPGGEEGLVTALEAHRFSATPVLISLPATVKLDVSAADDALLAGMKPKVRYNIRKGLRMGVSIREGIPDDVPLLHRLISGTAERQGFSPPPLDHVRAMHDRMAAQGFAKMFIAEVEGREVAAILTIPWGDTVIYKRGGWSGEGGEYRPNEVLHWTAMRWARDQGYRFYDFDGIEGHLVPVVLAGEPIPEEDLRSVSRFKLGFGGVPELRAPVLSYVRNPVARLAYDRLLPRLVHLPIFQGLEPA